MFAIRMQSHLANSKLIAEYYWPQHIADDLSLKGWATSKLEDLRHHDAPIAYGVLKPDDRGSECRVAKFENFDGMFVCADDCDPISEAMFNEFKRSQAIEGDILIAIGGYVGRPAIVEKINPSQRLNINRHLARFRPDPASIDAHYALAYLSSSIGNRQLRRQVTGSVQAGINLEDLRLIDIPIPKRNTQKYIGDKVRQAARLRSNAIGLKSSAKSNLNQSLPSALPESFRAAPRRIHKSFVSADSLSPEHGRALLGHDLFSDAGPLSEFVSDCKCGEAIRMDTRVAGDYPYYGASGPIDRHNEYNFDGEYLIVAQDGTIGCASVARGKFWANNHVWVLKVKSEFDPDSIAAYLDWCYPFWVGMTTGSVVPKVTAGNLLKVAVPRIVANGGVGTGHKLRNAKSQLIFSNNLILASKHLIEAMLSRVVSEDEFCEALDRLDRGDDGPDRAILSRIFEGGIDAVDTLPLFPDLDAHYQAMLNSETVFSDGVTG